MVSATLCAAKLEASAAESVLAELAQRLLAAGHVRPTFEAAARKRERRSPTGLPFTPIAVALPHAEPEHVVTSAIAVASLARPVGFQQMGAPQIRLDVQLVVMPALSTKEQAGALLAKLVEALQVTAFREALLAAATPEAMAASLAQHWGS
jgi:PTS system galactitol-specific IIA component